METAKRRSTYWPKEWLNAAVECGFATKIDAAESKSGSDEYTFKNEEIVEQLGKFGVAVSRRAKIDMVEFINENFGVD